jgi:hypothetical protein
MDIVVISEEYIVMKILVKEKKNQLYYKTKNEKTFVLFPLNVNLRFQLIIFNFSNYNGKKNFLQLLASSDILKLLLIFLLFLNLDVLMIKYAMRHMFTAI